MRLQSGQIRVLQLQPGSSSAIFCTLKSVFLDTKPYYEAISYAWGDASNTARILVDGKNVRVPQNLESALRHLRLPSDPLALWADSVCINQDDTVERSEQVAMMGKIFKCCSSVYIWLGVPAVTTIKTDKDLSNDSRDLISIEAEHVFNYQPAGECISQATRKEVMLTIC
tara:strand:- start:1561 stop:2070 length:510 start_codon:yes stop_codon:yes gene_type:complete